MHSHMLVRSHIDHLSNCLFYVKTELMVKACAEIVNELITAHENNKDVNLNGLKTRYSKKNGLNNQPKLVDIIAAIPEEYKKALLPKLKAKPVRTASGVSCIHTR